MVTNLAIQGKFYITEDKINMQVLCIRSMKTKDDHKIGNVNLKIFIEKQMTLENYHKASKYTEEDVTNRNKEMQKIIQT